VIAETFEGGPAGLCSIPEFIAHAREDVPALLAEIERLKARLTAAEAVALMFGWSPVVDGDRYVACYEVWCVWAEIAGADFLAPRNHPELSRERIAELAAKRQAEYEAKLARLRGETS
jgi:hypothetical protein